MAIPFSGWQCESCQNFVKDEPWECPICETEICDYCFDSYSCCKNCIKEFGENACIHESNRKYGTDF